MPIYGENCRFLGEDIKRGKKIFSKGDKINSTNINLIAAIGKQTIEVKKKIKIGFYTSGNELRRPTENLRGSQINNSNYYSLKALLNLSYIQTKYLGILRDEEKLITNSFLRNVKNYKSLSGVELRKECINYIKNNIKKINISDNINSFDRKFDIITMFHVLEHIPYQIDTLKVLKSKLKNKGKIIIEVPHAEDFLILQEELKEFKNFTFWSEHLILHTYKSLKSILLKSGFKNINIQYYQRYNFSNHLGWFLKRKPGGHNFYKEIVSDRLNSSYCENLKKLGQTDTLIATAE